MLGNFFFFFGRNKLLFCTSVAVYMLKTMPLILGKFIVCWFTIGLLHLHQTTAWNGLFKNNKIGLILAHLSFISDQSKKFHLTACESFRRYAEAAAPCACPCRTFYVRCQAALLTQSCACSPCRLLRRLHHVPWASVLRAAMPTRRPALRNCQSHLEAV